MTSRLRAHTLIATLCALGGVSLPSPRQVDPEPLSRPCARCGAAVGAPCDRRTLGAHPYHRVRMEHP